MPGETINNQLNLSKLKTSLVAHIYEKHVEIKNVDGTVDITPENYTWYMGGVVLEYKDHRLQPICTGKRILLKQNTASLWDDVLRMNQTAGGTWTEEMAIQVESQLLLAMHPTIDLNPNSTLQGMKRYDPADGPVEPVHRELKTRKRKLNSYELEQEAAKKAKKEQMMFMMDERHGREFKPTFKLLPYFSCNRKASAVGKGKEMVEQGRGSTRKPGRKLVRQLGFKRKYTDTNGKEYKECKIFTLLKIYQDATKYEAVFHHLDKKDLRTENKYQMFKQMMKEGKEYKIDESRAAHKNELENLDAYNAFIKSFVVLYSIDNKLKYDSDRVDKVTVDMLTEVTTELTSPQTEMKFDKMQPYKIVELLAEQSYPEKTESSNEGAKDLSVADLYNAAASKAMQTKPSMSAPVTTPKRVQRPRQPSITKGQAPAPLQNPPLVVLQRAGNQAPGQQHTQMQQPQIVAASQSPSQQPIQSPVLIQQNTPVQASADVARPVSLPISANAKQIPVQIPNNQRITQSIQRQMAVQSNVQPIQNGAQGLSSVRQVHGRINAQHGMSNFQGINATVRPVVNQSVAQGTTIQDTIVSPSMRHKITAMRRSTTQAQPQQISVPTQQTGPINIPSSSQMNQVQATPQINISTQPIDPTRATQLNIQNQMSQAQSAPQINIPVQVSDQNSIQQTQTAPRSNPGRIQMNQALSAPQINIPVQPSTPRMNQTRIPQVNVTEMNVMNPRINPRMVQSTDQNGSAQRGRQINLQFQQQILHQQLAAMAAQNPGIQLPLGYIRPYNGPVQMHPNIRNPLMQQQSFIQSGQNIVMPSSFPMQNQLLSGQQQNGIRPMRIHLPQQQVIMQRRTATPVLPQQLTMNQQLINGGQWIYQQNQNQLPQQQQNLQNPPWGSNNGKQ